jgi:hypothetical protein
LESNSVHSSAKTQVCGSDLSAVIPVVKVIAAIVTASTLPTEVALGLVLGHDALLELSVVVFAAVTSIHWDQHSIEFILSVNSGHKLIVRYSGIVEEEGHFGLFII